MVFLDSNPGNELEDDLLILAFPLSFLAISLAFELNISVDCWFGLSTDIFADAIPFTLVGIIIPDSRGEIALDGTEEAMADGRIVGEDEVKGVYNNIGYSFNIEYSYIHIYITSEISVKIYV